MEPRYKTLSGPPCLRGTCPLSPVCVSCICWGCGSSIPNWLLSPLFMLFGVNLVSLVLVAVLGSTLLLSHRRLLRHRVLPLVLPLVAGCVLTSGVVTLQALYDWLTVPLQSWIQLLHSSSFACFFGTTVFLIINSGAVLLALLFATIKMRLLDQPSMWAMATLTLFKIVLSVSLYVSQRRVPIQFLVQQLSHRAPSMQTYFCLLLRLLPPCCLVAAALFFCTYRAILSMRSSKHRRRQSSSSVLMMVMSPSLALNRTTSENSTFLGINAVPQPPRQVAALSQHVRLSRFVVLPLIPVYLFSLWLAASCIILDPASTFPLMRLPLCCASPITPLLSPPPSLREAFLLLSQSIVFFINFLSLLLSLNLVVNGSSDRRNQNL